MKVKGRRGNIVRQDNEQNFHHIRIAMISVNPFPDSTLDPSKFVQQYDYLL